MENKTYDVTKGYLQGIDIPQDTRTYKAISHEQLMDLTLNSVIKAGFKIENESYSSAREGKIANAKYTLIDVSDKEMQIQIGWQNSYDKSLTLKFAIGAKVFICKNGMVHGDMGAFKKKHQGTVQEFAPTAITEYIKRAGDIFSQMQKEREEMKKIELSNRQKAEMIGRMFIDEEFITSTQLNVIKRNLKHPEFDYNSPNTMWELYNFTTQGMKDIHPSLWMENHIAAHRFFANEAHIIPINAEIVIPEVGSHPQLDIFNETKIGE